MTGGVTGISILRVPPGKDAESRILPPPAGPLDGPLVSCLMVTRGARFPAVHAIDCFRRQTYAARELLIVCDRPDSPLAALVADINDPMIRLVETPPATLGELRNASIAHARGDMLCQWDDDDLYHPERIVMMVHALLASDVSAVMLHRWTIWWPDRRIIARSGRRPWEGTMLVRRGVLPLYPALPLGEDKAAIERLMALHTVVLVDQPRAYCYVVHGGNSYDVAHFETMIGWASDRTDAANYDAALDDLAQSFPVSAYGQRLMAGAET